MTRLGFATALFAVIVSTGCGDTSGVEDKGYAGEWEGTWVNISDASDQGTSTWIIKNTGAVSGTDVDPALGVTYQVLGTISGQGQVNSTATPNDGSGAASLNGALAVGDGKDSLSGNLTWGVTPPLTYRYTFTRVR